jgi:hypothetical protein
VVKQRRQLGLDKTWQAAVSSILASRGLRGFYMGWTAFVLNRLLIGIAFDLQWHTFCRLKSLKVRMPHFCFVP